MEVRETLTIDEKLVYKLGTVNGTDVYITYRGNGNEDLFFVYGKKVTHRTMVSGSEIEFIDEVKEV